jgi:hypothetical protein
MVTDESLTAAGSTRDGIFASHTVLIRPGSLGSSPAAVILAVRSTESGGDGWESNPPRTPQQRPADGFEDRGSDVRHCPAMSTQDENSEAGIRWRSLVVAQVRQNGCQVGCHNLCCTATHGPEPCRCRVLRCPTDSHVVLANTKSTWLVSFGEPSSRPVPGMRDTAVIRRTPRPQGTNERWTTDDVLM